MFKKLLNLLKTIFGFNSKNIPIIIKDNIKESYFKNIYTRDGLTVSKAYINNRLRDKSISDLDRIILSEILSLSSSHEQKIGDGTTFLSILLSKLYLCYENSTSKDQFITRAKNGLDRLLEFVEKVPSEGDLELYIRTTLKNDPISSIIIEFLNHNNINVSNIRDCSFRIRQGILTDKTEQKNDISLSKTLGHILKCHIPHAFRATCFSELKDVNISLFNGFLTIEQYEKMEMQLVENGLNNTLLICTSIDNQLYNYLHQKALNTGLNCILIPLTVDLEFKEFVRALQIMNIYDKELNPLYIYDDAGLQKSPVLSAKLDIERGDRITFEIYKDDMIANMIDNEIKRLTTIENEKLDITPDELSEIALLKLLYSNTISDINIDIHTQSFGRMENIKYLLEDLIKGFKHIKQDQFIQGRLLVYAKALDILPQSSDLRHILENIIMDFYGIEELKDIHSFVKRDKDYIINATDLRIVHRSIILTLHEFLNCLKENDLENILTTSLEAF